MRKDILRLFFSSVHNRFLFILSHLSKISFSTFSNSELNFFNHEIVLSYNQSKTWYKI